MPTGWVTGNAFDTTSVWGGWVSSSTASTTTGNIVWGNWTTSATTLTYNAAYAPTPEQIEASRNDQAERQARYDERRRIDREQREASGLRARELLLSLLTEEQKSQFETSEWFLVDGSQGGKYRIRLGVAGNVRLLEEGEEVEHLCCHASESVYDDDRNYLGRLPREDVMVGQLLMLKTDEPGFRRRANITNSRRYRPAVDRAMAGAAHPVALPEPIVDPELIGAA